MRASRLLSLLLLLQNRGRLTAAQLAAELEVSERTVYRDVESLSAAGIPVYAERGAGGGYRLVDGYRTRLTGLSGGEADSVFLATVPQAAAELGLGAEMAAAHRKILAALPEGVRERAQRVRDRFHLDAPAWFREPDRVPHLAAIASAFQSLAQGTGRQFRGGRVLQTVVEMEHAYLFVTGAGSGACLAVLAGEESDVGLIAYEMNVLVEQVGRFLETSPRNGDQSTANGQAPTIPTR